MDWIRSRLNADAQRWHSLWSIRATIFWCALNGAIGSLDVFAGTEIATSHPYVFVFANALGFAVIGIARVYRQPGLQ